MDQRSRRSGTDYQRIKNVKRVLRGAEDVSVLHLSQQGALCVKKLNQSVHHKVNHDKTRAWQRIKGVKRVGKRDKNVMALHLSQQSAISVNKQEHSVYHKMKRNHKSTKNCPKSNDAMHAFEMAEDV